MQRKYGRDKISVNPEGNPFRECPLTKTELALSHFFLDQVVAVNDFTISDLIRFPHCRGFIGLSALLPKSCTHIADQNFIGSVTEDY